MTAPTDPKVIEAIEADFAATVYQASRLAQLRRLGIEPPPVGPAPELGLRVIRRIEANKRGISVVR